MAFAFDTLGYATHLEREGVPRQQAEAHAVAAREFIMAELVTKSDLDSRLSAIQLDLDHRFRLAKSDFDLRFDRLDVKIDGVVARVTMHLGFAMAAGFAIMTGILALVLQ